MLISCTQCCWLRCMVLLYSLILLLTASPITLSSARQAPDYLIELYHKFSSGIGEVEDEEKNANKIVTIYRTGMSSVWEDQYLPQKAKLSFNISSFSKSDNILASNLRLYVDELFYSSESPADDEVVLTLKTSCRTKIKDRNDNLIKFSKIWKHTKQLKQSETGQWTKIKVTSAEKTLSNMQLYRHHYHFEVTCIITSRFSPNITSRQGGRTSIINRYAGRTPIMSVKDSKEPALVVYVQDNLSRPFKDMMEMNKRELEEQEEQEGLRSNRNYGNKPCQKASFYLNFEKLGWSDRIVFPTEINIYQCIGQCPYPFSSSNQHSSHAFMQGAWHNKFPEQISPPCCVPKDLKMASLMYINKEKDVVYKVYDDLIVGSCACL